MKTTCFVPHCNRINDWPLIRENLLQVFMYNLNYKFHLGWDLWCLPENQQEDKHRRSRAPPCTSSLTLASHWDWFQWSACHFHSWLLLHSDYKWLFYEVCPCNTNGVKASVRSCCCLIQGKYNVIFNTVLYCHPSRNMLYLDRSCNKGISL